MGATNLNSLCLQIASPQNYNTVAASTPLDYIMNQFCWCDFQNNGTFQMEQGYQFSGNLIPSHKTPVGSYDMQRHNESTTVTSLESFKQSDLESGALNQGYSKNYSGNFDGTNSKRDMVNYKVLEGHKYDIIDNPDKEQ